MSLDKLISDMFGENAGKTTSEQIQKQQELDKLHKNDVIAKVNSDAPFYVERLEHAVGLSTLMDFVNHHIKKGSPIKVQDDILYFDNFLSAKVLIGAIHPMIKNNETITFNPFLASYYDFIAHTKWDKCYVYKDRIYLIANKMEFNSYSCKNIPPFALSIAVDNVEKLQRWVGQTSLDIRKVIFQTEQTTQYVNENNQIMNIEELQEYNDSDDIPEEILNKWANVEEKTVSIPVQAIAENEVEQTIPLKFLDESNKHLIYEANSKKMAYEEQKLSSVLSMSPEHRVRANVMPNAGLLDYYGVNIFNEHQRDYGTEEKAFASKHQINEKDMGWGQFRDKAKDEYINR